MACIRWLCVALIAAFAAAADGRAQQGGGQPPQPNAAAAPVPAMPDEIKLNLLIRASIIALNQANKTGNYTVLQDLGAPAFRASNDSARLSQIFGQLRARNLDLTPVLFFTPKLLQPPQMNPQGILRLVGFFPTDPERVNFDLYFQSINNDWRIFGIGVIVAPIDHTAALAAQPGAAAPGQPPQTQPAAVKPEAPKAEAPKSEPAQPKPQERAAPKKEAPPPSRKPKPEASATQAPAPEETAVENRTTSNAVRIDLSDQSPAAQPQGEGNAVGGEAGASSEESGFWGTLFGQ